MSYNVPQTISQASSASAKTTSCAADQVVSSSFRTSMAGSAAWRRRYRGVVHLATLAILATLTSEVRGTIYHINRTTMKATATPEQIEAALESWRNQGRSNP